MYIYVCFCSHFAQPFCLSPANAIVSPQSCKYEVQTCKAKLEKFQLRFARRTTAVPITWFSHSTRAQIQEKCSKLQKKNHYCTLCANSRAAIMALRTMLLMVNAFLPESCISRSATQSLARKFQHAYKLHIRGVLCVLYSWQQQQSLRETYLLISMKGTSLNISQSKHLANLVPFFQAQRPAAAYTASREPSFNFNCQQRAACDCRGRAGPPS